MFGKFIYMEDAGFGCLKYSDVRSCIVWADLGLKVCYFFAF